MYGHNLARAVHHTAPIRYNADLALHAEQLAMGVSDAVHQYNFALPSVQGTNVARGMIDFLWEPAHFFYSLTDLMQAWYLTGDVCGYDYETGHSEQDPVPCQLFAFLNVSGATTCSCKCVN